MGYFTETMEALYETKSQCRADYERDISHSRQSNEWHRNNPGYAKGSKITYSPSYSGKPGSAKYEKAQKEAERATQPMRTAEDYRRREKLYGKDADRGDKNDKNIAKTREFMSKHPMAQKIRKNIAMKESFDQAFAEAIM